MNAILGFTEMMLDGLYGDVPPDAQGAARRHPGERPAPAAPDQRRPRPLQDRGRPHAARADRLLGPRRSSTSSTSRCARWPPRRGWSSRSTSPDGLPVAYGDNGRITQCLMNLAGNAIKFTRQGQVEIGVRRVGDELIYRVSDTGHRHSEGRAGKRVRGIPPGRLDRHAGIRRNGARPQHHQETSWRCTAAASGSRARSARAARSTSPFRCGRKAVTHERADDSLRRGQRVQPQDRAPAARAARPTG